MPQSRTVCSLARLMAMFQSDMKENKTQKIPNDMKTEAVAEMINFIYAGNVSNANVLNNMARALLSAAKPYQLNMLRSLMLSLSISIGNGMLSITHADLQPIYCLLPNKELPLRSPPPQINIIVVRFVEIY